ncbi:hypothetical protein [Solibacillus merdavium]|uniref:Uncharacterized protein n=1 Tax=Solibacillus merdavium TaxID=2762218 RepID=A0ABR8XPY0_9BACL|nr:hypothetical protein [Solibacillus merdavium]MBD8033997.1 hypothetical protein [Solibacillus merdavium]
MSKRFILMLAVTFIIFTTSSVILLQKEIEEPIILPIGTQALHMEEESFINMSYVTNHNEDIELKSIQVGELELVPYTKPYHFSVNTETEESDSLIQSYPYYDLHSVEFKVNENEYSALTAASNKNATAFFSNGVKQEFPLKLEVLTKKKEYLFVGVQSSDTAEGESETIFTITEAGTIEEIETVFPLANIKLYKEDKQMTLPYNTEKGEKLSIRISPNYRIWDSRYKNIIVHGTFATGEPFTEGIAQYIYELPPKKWMNDFVMEARDR